MRFAVRLLGYCLILALLVPGGAIACPFCYGMEEQSPIHADVAEHAVAALVEPVDELPSFQEALRNRSFGPKELHFRVVTVLRGRDTVTAGEVVTLKALGFFPPDAQYLLLSRAEDMGRPRVRAVSPSLSAFLEGVFALPAGAPDDPDATARRLRFMLDYLNDRDAAVAAAAYAEFAEAPYAVVKAALVPVLDPDAILGWIERPAHQSSQYGFLFLLVGMSGTEAHAARLWAWRDRPVWEEQDGLDGLLSAYMMLKRVDGLNAILAALEGAEDDRGTALPHAFVQSLRFHRDQEDVLSRADIIRGLQGLLANPTVAYLAVGELKAIEAWESLPNVMAAYQEHGEDNYMLRQTIRAYLRACPEPQAADLLAETLVDGGR